MRVKGPRTIAVVTTLRRVMLRLVLLQAKFNSGLMSQKT